MKIGALEAGGTKMVLGIFSQDGAILKEKTLPTLEPEETMPLLRGFFAAEGIDALGVAGFGPIDLHRASPTYGWITSTPKLAWRNYPFLQNLLENPSIPRAIDTGVNAAVLAERKLGAAQGLQDAVYVTVGTGIGGGISVGGSWYTACCTRRLGTCCCGLTPKTPTPSAYAPTTQAAWRVLPLARPSACAYRATRVIWRTMIPPLTLRLIILPKCA